MIQRSLKATQCILLTQIYDLGSPTMAELANGLLMDLSATRHSLGPLIRDRLVRLRVDPKDRRVKRATLTPTGWRNSRKPISSGERHKIVLSARSAPRARPSSVLS
jgi:DNA-binding MarR family transcriptional regulator